MRNKLSIIITGRNDEYYKDFLEKTSFNLNYTLKSLYDLKIDKFIEIIFIDWGSKKKLSENLFINTKYKSKIKFYNVNNKITSKEKDHDRRINTSKAHNLGVRLSKSNFCLLSHSDQIYPKYCLRNIYNLINGKIISKSTINSNYICYNYLN